MTNRHQRRAAEKLRRARTNNDEAARQARIAIAQGECQRLNAMHQTCQQALSLAGGIPDVPKPEGWTSEDGEPNFLKLAAIEDFMERFAETRAKLLGAYEEFYLALDALDPEATPLVRVPPTLVTP